MNNSTPLLSEKLVHQPTKTTRQKPIAALSDEAGSLHDIGNYRAPARLRTIGFAALTTFAIAVASFMVFSLKRTANPASRTAAPPKTKQLVSHLGVLRRHQTKSDLSPQVLQFSSFAGRFDSSGGLVIRSLIRRAVSLPGGLAVFVFVDVAPTRQQIAHLPSFARQAAESRIARYGDAPALGLVVTNRRGASGGCCISPSELFRSGDADLTGGGNHTLITTVVPDGVATVNFFLPSRGTPGHKGYRKRRELRAIVHNNVAAIPIGRFPGVIDFNAFTWFGPNGSVIKQPG